MNNHLTNGDRVPSRDQTTDERQAEQDEIAEFNQNTNAGREVQAENSDDLAMAQFIVSNRIYDVLLALLQEQRPDKARDLLELHRSGNLLGTAPSWNGMFLTDMMNDDESPSMNEEDEPSDARD